MILKVLIKRAFIGFAYFVTLVNKDYCMAFFISYPLSALGHDISTRADKLKG
jgi:hypothetical protein